MKPRLLVSEHKERNYDDVQLIFISVNNLTPPATAISEFPRETSNLESIRNKQNLLWQCLRIIQIK